VERLTGRVECEEALNERLGASPGDQDVIHVAPAWGVHRRGGPRELTVSENRIEDAVEIVRNTRAPSGCRETIASTRDIGHVAEAPLPVTERLAKGGDMEAQAALIDNEIRPNLLEQLSLTDDPGGTFDQCDEDVERATTQSEPNTLLLQESLRRT
jgi:hypothetical protein